MLSAWTVGLAGFLFLAVASREWNWRSTHRYELGPSGYIVALGLAGLALSIGLGALVYAGHIAAERADRLESSVAETNRQIDIIIKQLVPLRRIEADRNPAWAATQNAPPQTEV